MLQVTFVGTAVDRSCNHILLIVSAVGNNLETLKEGVWETIYKECELQNLELLDGPRIIVTDLN